MKTILAISLLSAFLICVAWAGITALSADADTPCEGTGYWIEGELHSTNVYDSSVVTGSTMLTLRCGYSDGHVLDDVQFIKTIDTSDIAWRIVHNQVYDYQESEHESAAVQEPTALAQYTHPSGDGACSNARPSGNSACSDVCTVQAVGVLQARGIHLVEHPGTCVHSMETDPNAYWRTK